HALMAGMCGLQTSHRYGNATMLASDFVLGIGNRWANRHTGSPEVYCRGRCFVHVDIEPTQIGRVFAPDYGIVSDAKAALQLFVEVAKEWKAAGKLKDRSAWADECSERKRTMLRKTNFENVPMKPQRVYQCLNRAFDDNDSYLGLIRQAQRGFNMDYQVSLAFDNINAPETGGYGVDHVKVAEGLGCKAIRVHKQEEIDPAIEQAEKWMTQYGVPVIVE